MVIQTRIATINDLDGIVQLWLQFTEEADFIDHTTVDAKKWSDNRLKPQLEGSKVIVAESDGELIGFIGGIDHQQHDWVPEGVLYVVDLYVLPHARVSNAAHQLYRTAKEMIWSHYREVWTNTHISNRRMQVILKRWKFKPLHNFSVPGAKDQYYYRRINQI